MRRVLALLVLTLACVLVPSRAARAAPTVSDKAVAQSLFDDALKLMTSGRYDQACPKLEESVRLDAAMGTRFRLAECYEATGRTASAWAGYLEVADLARTAGQGSRERVAREKAARLEPGLAHLEIVVASPAPAGLEIRRDEVVVGAAQWGSKIPVDPGTVRVLAQAPGKTTWKTTVTIARAGETAVVRVPALEAAPGAPLAAPAAAQAPAIATAPTSATGAPQPAREPAPSGGGERRLVGGVLFGVGAAGMATSGVLGLVALSKYNGADAHCKGDVCDPQGKQDTDSARRLAAVATVVFGVSAAVAVGGAVLWLTAPSSSSAAQKASVRLRVAPQAVLLEGAF